ncbi:hypothetical protein LCGC14_1323280 [marine sediment metagenome]|uniref:Uncharacterized protein n=1 Tax=marine sediment metagenome TaxID=412755 RepID=A0A0F9MZN7_9ZZZZ
MTAGQPTPQSAEHAKADPLARFNVEGLTVPRDEIRPGGPGKDGTPSLTRPKAIAAKGAKYRADVQAQMLRRVGAQFRRIDCDCVTSLREHRVGHRCATVSCWLLAGPVRAPSSLPHPPSSDMVGVKGCAMAETRWQANAWLLASGKSLSMFGHAMKSTKVPTVVVSASPFGRSRTISSRRAVKTHGLAPSGESGER